MTDKRWKCQSCGDALDHDPIGTAAVCEACVTTAIRKKYETDLRAAAERAAKVIAAANDLSPYSQQWVEDVILAELEPTKPASVSDKQPCLDIDGNALSVGDTVVVVGPGKWFKVVMLSGDGSRYLNELDEWRLGAQCRKVAAPVKTLVLTFTRIYADAYRDEQETA